MEEPPCPPCAAELCRESSGRPDVCRDPAGRWLDCPGCPPVPDVSIRVFPILRAIRSAVSSEISSTTLPSLAAKEGKSSLHPPPLLLS